MLVLDYSKFFYTIPIQPESQYLTCFIVPGSGSYLFMGCPMGMKISPSAAVAYARRRLAKWQVLYEPGQEQPLEGRCAERLTAVPSMRDTSLATPTSEFKETYAEPTAEMKHAREPPTQFVIQYMSTHIDDCLVVITA